MTRNGQTVTLHAPQHKDVATVEDLLEIRRFLEQSDQAAIGTQVATSTQLLVVNASVTNVARPPVNFPCEDYFLPTTRVTCWESLS